MNKLQEKALDTLSVIEKQRKKYEEVNDQLRKISQDFPPYVEAFDHDSFSSVVDLLDEILGDELASYYLFDAPVSGNGAIFIDDKEYPINSIEDIKKYLNR